MSTFVDALDRYLTAREAHKETVQEGRPITAREETAAQTLAQAGDALESELRRMMREEANAREARKAASVSSEFGRRIAGMAQAPFPGEP